MVVLVPISQAFWGLVDVNSATWSFHAWHSIGLINISYYNCYKYYPQSRHLFYSEAMLFLKALWIQRQAGVEGLELTSSHEDTKIKTNCLTAIDKKTGTYQKRCSTSKDKEEATTRE